MLHCKYLTSSIKSFLDLNLIGVYKIRISKHHTQNKVRRKVHELCKKNHWEDLKEQTDQTIDLNYLIKKRKTLENITKIYSIHEEKRKEVFF